MNAITAAFQVAPDQLDDQGLVFIGGHYTPPWMLAAYRRGIFPWPCFVGLKEDGTPCFQHAWFSPDPRCVMTPQSLQVPQRLERRLRRHEFQYSMNQQFQECISRCARRDEDGWEETWLSPELEQGYLELQAMGQAISFEVWQDDELVGGVLGVCVGGYFSAESMFHTRRDASKAGLVTLVRALGRAGYQLVDVQQPSPHVCQLGAYSLSRQSFLARHYEAVSLDVAPIEC